MEFLKEKLQASEAPTSLDKTGAGLGNLGDSDGGVTSSEHGGTLLLLLRRYLSFE